MRCPFQLDYIISYRYENNCWVQFAIYIFQMLTIPVNGAAPKMAKNANRNAGHCGLMRIYIYIYIFEQTERKKPTKKQWQNA